MYKKTGHWISVWSHGAVRAALKASARVSKRSIQIDFVVNSDNGNFKDVPKIYNSFMRGVQFKIYRGENSGNCLQRLLHFWPLLKYGGIMNIEGSSILVVFFLNYFNFVFFREYFIEFWYNYIILGG